MCISIRMSNEMTIFKRDMRKCWRLIAWLGRRRKEILGDLCSRESRRKKLIQIFREHRGSVNHKGPKEVKRGFSASPMTRYQSDEKTTGHISCLSTRFCLFDRPIYLHSIWDRQGEKKISYFRGGKSLLSGLFILAFKWFDDLTTRRVIKKNFLFCSVINVSDH